MIECKSLRRLVIPTVTQLAVCSALIVYAAEWAFAQSVTANGTSSPVSIYRGDTVTVGTNRGGGAASTTDWVGIYTAGAPDTSYLDWYFLNGSKTAPSTALSTASFGFKVNQPPATNYQFRYFSNYSYERLATSGGLTVHPMAIKVNSVSPPQRVVTDPNQTVEIQVLSGLGDVSEWVGLYRVGAADTAYIDWTYLNGLKTIPQTGLHSATFQMTLPVSSGAYEFRWFNGVGYTRIATSATVLAASITISAIPRVALGSPYTFFDACNNMSSWPTVGARTLALGSFRGDLDAALNEALSACISNINNAGMTLTVEAEVFQGNANPGCGNNCYPLTQATISRLINDLGMSASQIRVRMQEPLTTIPRYGCEGCSGLDVVNYTVTYLSNLRSDFPGIQVSLVEAYPALPAATLNWFIAALDAACDAQGVIPPDTFEIDHDLNNPAGSWSDINSIINTTHGVGWMAGYIFGSPVPPPGGANWQQTANSSGFHLKSNGITPDVYVFESWEGPHIPSAPDPWDTVPETVPSGYTFMSAVKTFIDLGFFPW